MVLRVFCRSIQPLRSMNRRIVFLVLFTVITTASAGAQSAEDRIGTLKSLTDSLFTDLGTDTPAVSIGLFKGQEKVFDASYGQANLEWNIPASSDTVFLLASVSKQFTAYAIATLAADGRLDLDADIRTLFPEMHAFGAPITFRHLVHHTSGLRDEFDLLGMAGWRMDDVITHQAILDLAYKQESLNFPVGSAYSYSNTGYTLLAETVRRLTGKTLAAWLLENVFAPLGMESTHVHDSYASLVPRVAQGHEPNGDGGYRKQLYVYENVGSTGVFSSVDDLGRWAHALNHRTIGSDAVHELTHTRGVLTSGDTLAYAFGQSVNTLFGHARVTHGGWHRGFRTVLMRFPDDDMAVVVLANTNSINPSDAATAIMKHLFVPGADSLKGYEGVYDSEELGTMYRLEWNDGALRAHHDRNEPFTLTWNDPDAFTTDAWYFDSIAFQRNSDGQVTGFEGTTDRARKVSFLRQ